MSNGNAKKPAATDGFGSNLPTMVAAGFAFAAGSKLFGAVLSLFTGGDDDDDDDDDEED